MTVLLAGCCVRPSSAWDQTTLVEGPQTPSGVVLLVDRKTKTPVTCSGTVIQQAPSGGGFRAYVLTARHCVNDDDLQRWGVVAPSPGAHMFAAPELVEHALPATRVASSRTAIEPFALRFTTATVDWVDDWAILAVDSLEPLPVLPLDPGDAAALAPGTPVSLMAYFDWQLGEVHGSWYEPKSVALHAHPFGWTGVPQGVSQQGHSGSPIVRDGRVVAVHSGADFDSNFCRLFCGTWPVALRLVNVATIRREAEQQGLRLDASPETVPRPGSL